MAEIGQQTTLEEREAYFTMIQEWILMGMHEEMMMARLRDEAPNAKAPVRRKWIRTVRDRIAEIHRKSKDFEFDLSLTRARFLDLYNRQIEAKEFADAHKTLVDLSKIMGTYPTSKSNPAGHIENFQYNDNRRIEDCTDEELAEKAGVVVVIPSRPKRIEPE